MALIMFQENAAISFYPKISLKPLFFAGQWC